VAVAVVSAAREEILGRVRAALRDVPSGSPDEVPVPRAYRRTAGGDHEALVSLLLERLLEYRAQARRVARGELDGALTQACDELGLARVAVPPGLPLAWRPRGVSVVDDTGLSAAELDEIDGVVTGCALAIAETGTVALDGQGPSGRRALTLVPDVHICVVAADQIVGSVPEGVAGLASAAAFGAPITLVSGPSATSDIELSRVEGVHGPRRLLVLIVG
jgi:L-lactate dehydrogenase complex protein LldG